MHRLKDGREEKPTPIVAKAIRGLAGSASLATYQKGVLSKRMASPRNSFGMKSDTSTAPHGHKSNVINSAGNRQGLRSDRVRLNVIIMKFNRPNTTTRTENYAGGEAFAESPKLEFLSILLTSFVNDQYYRTEEEAREKVIGLIDSISDKKFLAKSAIYARTKFGMRSISHLVAAELAKRIRGEEWAKDFYYQVIYRPDDMMEILAYYLNEYGKPIPNCIKKGFALALAKFNDYQIAKYRGEKATVSLVDVVNLVHPKPVATNKVALKKLVEGTLRAKDTWEVELTEAGQTAKDEEDKEEKKAEVWEKLIKEKKLGYFALLRNLRNILEQSPNSVDGALEMLVDRNLIKKSLVLPFRFSTAIEQIEELNCDRTRDVLVALNKAIDLSLDNVPKLKGKTLIALDGSGSMRGKPIKIGALFATALFKTNNADYLTFSNDAKYITLNPLDSTLTLTKKIEEDTESGGTNFHSIFETANRPYDRIIILSDMQGWIGRNAPTATFAEYKRRIGTNPIIYSIDLQGYGTLQFPKGSVYCLAGFSDKIFDIMKLLETDKQALLSEIEKVEL